MKTFAYVKSFQSLYILFNSVIGGVLLEGKPDKESATLFFFNLTSYPHPNINTLKVHSFKIFPLPNNLFKIYPVYNISNQN